MRSSMGRSVSGMTRSMRSISVAQMRDAEVKPTSTSLRDLCHQILKKKFAGVAEQMMVHTVHRSSKSLQAAYLANRPKVVCSKARKKEIKKKKQCSRKIKPKRRNVKRR